MNAADVYNTALAMTIATWNKIASIIIIIFALGSKNPKG